MLCLGDGPRKPILFWGMLEVGSRQEDRVGGELGEMDGREVAVRMYCVRKEFFKKTKQDLTLVNVYVEC